MCYTAFWGTNSPDIWNRKIGLSAGGSWLMPWGGQFSFGRPGGFCVSYRKYWAPKSSSLKNKHAIVEWIRESNEEDGWRLLQRHHRMWLCCSGSALWLKKHEAPAVLGWQGSSLSFFCILEDPWRATCCFAFVYPSESNGPVEIEAIIEKWAHVSPAAHLAREESKWTAICLCQICQQYIWIAVPRSACCCWVTMTSALDDLKSGCVSLRLSGYDLSECGAG